MRSQWENFLTNLGDWEGSFTQVSPAGEILKDTPSRLLLEGLEDDKAVRLTLRRFPPDSPADEVVREYRSLGKDILFFDGGAFSQGTIQRSPLSAFGAEFGFVADNRRLRLVEIFTPEGDPDRFTLIREKRAGTDAPERPPLTLEALLGTWEGEAVTISPSWLSPDIVPTRLELRLDGGGRLVQTLEFGTVRVCSTARIEDSNLYFDDASPPVRVSMLPDGASATFPERAPRGNPFFLEAGWLMEDNRRDRLIRRYSETGEWLSLTWVRERKVGQK